MPTPRKGESRSDYISRCIPYVMKEGNAKNGKQAAAICNGLWRKHKNSKAEASSRNDDDHKR